MLQEKLSKLENTNTATKRKCIVKKEVGSHHTGEGEDFWCNTRNKTQLLSQYLKEDGNAIANIKVDAVKQIGGPASVFECEKKDVTVFTEGTYIYYFAYTEKGDWGNLYESRQ